MSLESKNEKEFIADEALAANAQRGIHADRIRLIHRYIPLVKARVSGYAGGNLEPEDLAQEGMIGLMNAVEHYDPARGASFRTFALLCIDRSVISVVRASMAAKKIPPSTLVPLEESESPQSEGDSPEEIVVSNENARFLASRLEGVLSDLERKVFYLYLGGCEYEDIARRVQIPLKTVDNALCRARRKIKKLI